MKAGVPASHARKRPILEELPGARLAGSQSMHDFNCHAAGVCIIVGNDFRRYGRVQSIYCRTRNALGPSMFDRT
jgi:hypothetical protein